MRAVIILLIVFIGMVLQEMFHYVDWIALTYIAPHYPDKDPQLCVYALKVGIVTFLFSGGAIPEKK